MPAGEMLAHSARTKEDISAQTYQEHIQHSMKFAEKFFDNMACFHTNKALMKQTRTTILQAANKHDLGKLFEDNQRVLRSTFDKQKPLPIPHEEAGFWYFFKKNLYESAMLVACHHIGLKNIPLTDDWEKTYLRISGQNKTKNLTQLSSLLEKHQKLVPMDVNNMEGLPLSLSPLGFRLMLSCLVDADHLDTAQHYKNEIEEVDIKLFASKRFNQLTNYVRKLQHHGNISMRNELRNLFFDECANIKDQPSSFIFTDAPVGLGKTTSLMASALKLAEQTNARRIIVVLPLSTLISQSSSRYQDAMQLKNSEEFIAENHHRADFSHPYSRALTERWTQPVVVTSHVQFFETLASSKTGRLRKLHQVPGSIIIIDEAHMALPIQLWPLAWQWMNELQDSWGCRFLFASGTMGKFWEMEDFVFLLKEKPEWIQHRIDVKFLNSSKLAVEWYQEEVARVHLSPLGAEIDRIAPWTIDDLLNHVANAIGPRLVVLNTVASAAFVADFFHTSNRFQDGVYHLSTALTFLDRIEVLDEIKQLLDKKTKTEWVLIATSIAETGLDVSFRNGFREYMSFASMLQFKGRINRENEFDDSSMVMFELASGQNPLIKQPWKSVRATQNVLKSMLREKLASPAYSTEALRRELQETQISSAANTLLESERKYKFEDIEKNFKVIQSETKLVLVDSDSFDKLERGFINATERKKLFRDKAIQMYATKINEMELPESSRFPGVFLWNYGYDNFLGYMRGVIDLKKLQDQSYVF